MRYILYVCYIHASDVYDESWIRCQYADSIKYSRREIWLILAGVYDTNGGWWCDIIRNQVNPKLYFFCLFCQVFTWFYYKLYSGNYAWFRINTFAAYAHFLSKLKTTSSLFLKCRHLEKVAKKKENQIKKKNMKTSGFRVGNISRTEFPSTNYLKDFLVY